MQHGRADGDKGRDQQSQHQIQFHIWEDRTGGRAAEIGDPNVVVLEASIDVGLADFPD